MVDKKTVKDLEKELKEFLESRPELAYYQNEIDAKLMHLKDPRDRIAVLSYMLQEKLTQLQEKLLELQKLTRK